ncbi:Alcohol dehydrogenase GroES domain protein [Chthoniobacter flavus Ellin428]|uniref:Alcohol dehydrogenase GroES domain protein n=1 Tax=Chthoniobacter flavus Ellin428 TaxID=497964 RepID=B4CWI2_9BACT|nr:alcohol dehydrogenase catalytic domain-containing protein [Chthoniobacter flavus]EDY21774.1 Alcohol dehydrogenase GroES domain protein [Chthoniobacter flavus Ellin428]
MKSNTMKGVGVVPQQKELRVIDHPEPSIEAPNELKIRTLEVGVCGTDREICTFAYGQPPAGGDYLLLGHECLGEVLEVGSGVKNFKPGDLVVPSVRRPCTDPNCRPCREGRQDFCVTWKFTERGINQRHGYMTERFVEEERFLTPVPKDLRDLAVMAEPLTIAEKGLTQAWQVQKRLTWAHDNRDRQRPRPRSQCRGPRRRPHRPARRNEAAHRRLPRLRLLALAEAEFQGRHRRADWCRNTSPTCKSPRKISPNTSANIDLIYEAVGRRPSPPSMSCGVLGINGVYILTGIPAEKPPIPVYRG